jgi:hypothetical protein
VTTIRYTLPRSVGQAGCQLYSEGHFSIPASLVGPTAVGGGGWGGGCVSMATRHLLQTVLVCMCVGSRLSVGPVAVGEGWVVSLSDIYAKSMSSAWLLDLTTTVTCDKLSSSPRSGLDRHGPHNRQRRITSSLLDSTEQPGTDLACNLYQDTGVLLCLQ